MGEPCILSIDQGTTSSRAILFDRAATVVASSQYEFAQNFPQDGWVEHDPEEIWQTTIKAVRDVLRQATGCDVVAIGITNQRETTLVWDRETGKPVYNAIVWQDRRTNAVCRQLEQGGHLDVVRAKTGLLLDPYFSATKIAWILDNVSGARHRAEAGKLAFGTVDSFLIWRLTGGQVHATDATNASRTSLFDITKQDWDTDLLDLFNVPPAILPDVKDSADDFGMTKPSLFGRAIPILGVAGDQQAATFGQCCFEVGAMKSTYGTGCFALVNTGHEILHSRHKLLTTVAYRLDGKPTYALEGSIFVAGAAIQWLRDGLQILDDATRSEQMAIDAGENHGVWMVPAFTGLGAPHWQPDARAAIYGMTRATGREALVRAALESVCFQTHDLISAMKRDGVTASILKVDGGMVANNWMTQFLSSLLDLPIARPQIMETTALGAAFLAGLEAGIYSSLDDIAAIWKIDREFSPQPMDRERLLSKWNKAVESTLNFQ